MANGNKPALNGANGNGTEEKATQHHVRFVPIGDVMAAREMNPKASNNKIRTSRYNVLTFLPLNLFQQFQRVANIYFLLIAILSSFPSISPIGPATSIAPLVFVLAVTALKDGIEDWQRHRFDRAVNNRVVEVYRTKDDGTRDWERITWQELELGDMVKIRRDEKVPADVMALGSSERGGICYVDTADLDGETNLKRKESFKLTRELPPLQQAAFAGFIECEVPNKDLRKFDSAYHRSHPPTMIGESVSINNLLLRECVLRNTEYVIGIACYTGADSKIAMQNAGTKRRVKQSKIDRAMNWLVLFVFIYLVICVIICTAAGAGMGYDKGSLMWYMADLARESVATGFLRFLTFIIVFNTMIPISLYVTMEIVRVFHAKFVDWDHQMYHKPVDTPARTNNSNLCDEIGQIEYIFSDKTGTLTRNQMDFMKACIAGYEYGRGLTEIGKAVLKRRGEPIPPDPEVPPGIVLERGFNFRDPALMNGNWRRLPHPEVIEHFMYMLALCNDILVERDPENPQEYSYKASSPDELALVTGGKKFGFILRAADDVSKTVERIDTRRVQTFQLLNSFEFDSDRKRQSVILRHPDTGSILLYVKGADSVVMSRLHPNSPFVGETQARLDQFANDGLRTLALAMKEIPLPVYEEWSARFRAASAAIEDRDGKIAALANEMEQGLFLVGATAIEDKLQEGVPDAIATLQRANLRIWILTGDKWDTAINIGHACSLLNEEMKQLEVQMPKAGDHPLVQRTRGQPRAVREREERAYIHEVIRRATEHSRQLVAMEKPYSVIIDGESLVYALETCEEFPTRELFRELGMASKAVVCCRVSPDQKASVVAIVNDKFGVLDDTPNSEDARKVFQAEGRAIPKETPRIFTTLGIGDGANDVKMIKQANIGVGISGLEGMQAVMNSDFSIAQFRFLTRLLLWHGRLNYIRVTKFLKYFFFKNITLTMTQFWFALFSFFSGQVYHDGWHSSLFNIVFTSLPVLFMAVLDRDLEDTTVMLYAPHVYTEGQEGVWFRPLDVVMWFVEAVYQSVIYFFFPAAVFAFNGFPDRNGRLFGMWSDGSVTFTCVIFAVNLRLAMECRAWTVWTHIVIWLSIASWWLFALIFDAFPISFLAGLRSAGIFNTIYELFASANYYFVCILTICVGLAPAYVYKYLERWIFEPPLWCVLQECQMVPSLWNEPGSPVDPVEAAKATEAMRAKFHNVDIEMSSFDR